jgi:hypothetical protein
MSYGEPGMAVHSCNPNTWKMRQEDHEYKNNLGYIARPCLKKKKVPVLRAWFSFMMKILIAYNKI